MDWLERRGDETERKKEDKGDSSDVTNGGRRGEQLPIPPSSTALSGQRLVEIRGTMTNTNLFC